MEHDPAASPPDPVPGPSSSSMILETQDTLSPSKKRPTKALSSTEKLMVMNVYKHTFKNWPKNLYWSLVACVNKTAEILGISPRTVRVVVKENKTTGRLSSPKKKGRKTNFKQNIDEYTYSAIRRIVHQFFRRNELPTITKVRIDLGTSISKKSISFLVSKCR